MTANIEYSNLKIASRWRLIHDGAACGAWNMAVDEALLLSVRENDAPILRFYGWQPSCLSIGRFQKREKLQLDDVSYVRRPTGGRAVWHDLEVTYSVVFREELLPHGARSVVDSYRFISEGFLRGLRHLGVQALIAQSSSTRSRSQNIELKENALNCFESQTRADFVVDGRKILGAAQCRRNGAILQHGSLLLDINGAAWSEKVGGDLSRMVSLRDLGIRVSRADVQNALARGVGETFGAFFDNDILNAREIEMANALLHKYNNSLWNDFARDDTPNFSDDGPDFSAEERRDSVL